MTNGIEPAVPPHLPTDSVNYWGTQNRHKRYYFQTMVILVLAGLTAPRRNRDYGAGDPSCRARYLILFGIRKHIG